jgi:glycosyltransferase involved in cell wall biosynthesis
MKYYIKKVFISILNQSFQNFEIIIVNDHSNDTTLAEIKKLQLEDNRIKLINHSKNLGVYNSRVDAIMSSKGKYFILIDPDDIFINPNLFQHLYNYNLKYNLDIIEYTVICYIEKSNIIKIIERYYHFHKFSKTIISQPELDDIYYYWNSKNNISSKIGCRVIWNKIIRRKTLMKSIEYIGKDYYKNFFVTAEDTIINLISFHFAQNYSNINFPGYMYNIREKSMTRGNRTIDKAILFCYNHLLYFSKFYAFIKNFNKKRNILFNELLDLNKRLALLNYLTKNKTQEILIFYREILNDKYAFSQFKRVVKIFALNIKL